MTLNNYLTYLISETTSVPMQRDGSVRSQDFLDGVKDNTCLLTLMMANNETGVVFPVAQLSRLVNMFCTIVCIFVVIFTPYFF